MSIREKAGILVILFSGIVALGLLFVSSFNSFKSYSNLYFANLKVLYGLVLAPNDVDIAVQEVLDYKIDNRFGLGGGCNMAAELEIPWIYNWGHGKDFPNQPEMACKKSKNIDFFYTIGKTDNSEVYNLEKFKVDYLSDAEEKKEYLEYEFLINDMISDPKYAPNALASYLLIPFYVKSNPGYYYVVGNEPDLEKTITTTEYARQFYLVNKRLKKYDPKAKIANGGFLSVVPELCNKLSWSDKLSCETNGQFAWIESFRSEHKRLYGRYPELDFWNIHPYIYGLDPDGGVFLQQAKDRVINFKDYLDLIGEGHKKIWISEFGILEREGKIIKGTPCTDHGCLSKSELNQEFEIVTNKFMVPLVNWYKQQPYIERWFWFYGGQTYSWDKLDYLTTIYKIDGEYNALGKGYVSLMRIPVAKSACIDLDFDKDCTPDIFDLLALLDVVLNPGIAFDSNFDINQDSKINAFDLIAFVDLYINK